jgi:hypothetical protein
MNGILMMAKKEACHAQAKPLGMTGLFGGTALVDHSR